MLHGVWLLICIRGRKAWKEDIGQKIRAGGGFQVIFTFLFDLH